MYKMLLFSKTENTKKLICLLLLSVLFFNLSSCKKESAAAAFTYQGKWTVNYNFTTGSMAKGSFTATLKSDGKWDYVEGGFSKVDAGTWSSLDNTINFVFNFFQLAQNKSAIGYNSAKAIFNESFRFLPSRTQVYSSIWQ